MKNILYFITTLFSIHFRKLLFLIVFSGVCFSSFGQRHHPTVTAGAWGSSPGWKSSTDPNCMGGTTVLKPTISDDVLICNNLGINTTEECRNIQVDGILNISGSLLVDEDMEVNGTVTIAGTGTLTVNQDITVRNGGVLIIDGAFSSTLSLIGNLIIENGGTVNLVGGNLSTIDINGNINIQSGGTLDTDTNEKIQLAGNWIKNGTFNAGSGLVEFNGGVAQTISGNTTTFNNVDVVNSGTVINPSAPVVIGGTINVNTGTTVNISNIFTVGGVGVMNINTGGRVDLNTSLPTRNTTINSMNIASGGTFSHNSNQATAIFSGNITNNGTFTTASTTGNYGFTFRGNITNTGTFNLVESPQIVFDGTTTILNTSTSDMRFAQNNSGTMSITGNVTINAATTRAIIMPITSTLGVLINGTLTNNSNYLTVSRLPGTGTFSNTGTVTVTSGQLSDVSTLTNSAGSTFIYDYAGNGTIRGGTGATYGNLEINGTGTKTLEGGVTNILNDLTVTAPATFNTTTNNTTLTFNGAGNQKITGVTDFYNLTVDKSSGNLELAAGVSTIAGTLTLTDGNLVLNGDLSLTNVIHTSQLSGGGAGSYIVTGTDDFIRNGVDVLTAGSVFFPIGSLTTTYNPLTIVNTGDFGDVSVNVENLDPAVGRPRVARVWNIQSTGVNAPDIRFDWSSGFAVVGTMTTPTVYQFNSGWGTATLLSTLPPSGQTVVATILTTGDRQFAVFDLPSIDYYAVVNNGNWNDAATWSTACGGGGGAGTPTANDNVFICNGITANLNVNGQCKDLTIQSNGILRLEANDLTVTGNTTIQSNGVLNDNTAGGILTLEGDFTNSGTFSASGGLSTFNFTGNNTTYLNTGTINLGDNILTLNATTVAGSTFTNTGPTMILGNIVGTAGGGTENLINNSTLAVTGTGAMFTNLALDFFTNINNEVQYTNSGGSQTLANTNYNNITIGGNNVTKVTTTGIINVLGNWTENTTGTATRNMLGTVQFVGSTPSFITIGTAGSKDLGNVVINKTGGATMTLLGAGTGGIEGSNLNLFNGILDNTNGKTISFNGFSNGSLTSYIQLLPNGTVVTGRDIVVSTPILFPIGTTTYNPIVLRTSSTLLPTISVGLSSTGTPVLPTNTASLNLQWEVQSNIANTSISNVTLNWVASNITGTMSAAARPYFYNSDLSSWIQKTGTPTPIPNPTSVTTPDASVLATAGTAYQFTVVEPITTFYSRQFGNWTDNTNTWSIIGVGGADCGCSPAGIDDATVVIGTNHNIIALNAIDIGVDNEIELQGTATLTLNNGNTNPIAILTTSASSIINLQAGTLNLAGATTINGTLRNNGGIVPNSILTFANGSTYEHQRDGGVIPTATWNVGSTCSVFGINNIPLTGGLGQIFANFTWFCGLQSVDQVIDQNIIVQGTTRILNTGTANITLASTADYTWTTTDFIINPFLGNTAQILLTNGGGHTGTLRISGNFNGAITPAGNAIWGDNTLTGIYTDKIEFVGGANQIINLPNFVGGGSATIELEVNKTTGSVLFARTDFTSSVPPILNIASGTFALNQGTAQTLTLERIISIGTLGTLSMQNEAHLLNVEGTGNTFTGTLAADANTTINYNGTVAQDIFTPNTGSYGNISFNGSTTKTLLGNISVSGNFTNNSGVSNFDANSRTVTFTGTVATQAISSSGGVNFHNLTVNKTAGIVSLGFGTGVNVANNLIFANGGRLRLNNNSLSYAAAGSITASAADGWVETNTLNSLFVLTTVTDPFLFPVGNQTSYHPLEIANTVANTSVRFGLPSSTITGAGSWYVNNGNQASDITMIGPVGGVPTDASIHRKISATDWQLIPTTELSGDFTAYYTFAANTEEFAVFSSPFITTWTTSAAGETITIPTTGTGYNYTVYWENESNPSINSGGLLTFNDFSPNYDITLGSAVGNYKVQISGAFPQIYFNDTDDTNDSKIISIDQWGSIQWQSMENAFEGCQNLTYAATDVPILTGTNMSGMFRGCTSLIGNGTIGAAVGGWNVSGITNFSEMFDGATSFNSPLNNWIVSGANNFSGMFDGAIAFDQDLNNWTFATVGTIDFSSMFEDATSFNRNITNWNTSNVTDMSSMFDGATNFDQNLANWDIGGITTPNSMENMLDDSGLSELNYDNTLIGWRDDNFGMQTIPTNVTLGADGLTYCNSVIERGELISSFGWTINNDQNCIEIVVSGNGNEIINLDTTPDLSDNTDFGNVIQCGTDRVTKIFTIENAGGTDLIISSITITGTHASDFNLGITPTLLLGGQTRPFRITFKPSAIGLREATVTINSNDPDENPYTFTIQGIGIVDNEPPVITPQDDFVRNADSNNCFYTNRINPILPLIRQGRTTDNCRVRNFEFALSGATTDNLSTLFNAQFNIGITTVVWRAIDEAGNASLTDEFIVTVADSTSPSIEAPMNISVNSDLYSCTIDSINIDFGNPLVRDNCVFRVFNNAPAVFPIGQTIITWTAIDSAGNTSTARQTVTVNEQLFVIPADSLILVDIYNKTGGDNWNTRWNLNSPVSTWRGVSVKCGRVNELNLSNNNLTGVFPSSFLGLANRTSSDFSLNISSNRLGFDSIEDFVGQLSNFNYSPQADIYSSRTEISRQSASITFTSQTEGKFNRYQWYKDQVAINGATSPTLTLTNILPVDAGVYTCRVANIRATALILERRPITLIVEGFVNPSDSLLLVAIFQGTDGENWNEIWDLRQPVYTWQGVTLNGGKIRELDLSSTNMTGELPDVFDAEFFSELRYLSLFDNNLQGQIPSSLGAITSLTYLDLDKNDFRGSVPVSFGNLINLQALWLSRNNLTSLPEEFGNMVGLKNLYLNGNKFSSLPQSIGNLTELLVLNISDNELETLPSSITNLTKLIELYANRNYISSIPIGMKNIVGLTVFEINSNELIALPNDFLELTNLSVFRVAENNLEFDDLLPYSNRNFSAFDYSPQADIGEQEDILKTLNSSISFTIPTQGNGNQYQWFKDEMPITTTQNFTINRLRNVDAGVYRAQITNPRLPDLILRRSSILLRLECQNGIIFKISQPNTTTFCASQPFILNLEVDTEFASAQTIRWRKDGVILAFADERRYTATQEGVYTAEITTEAGCTAVSNKVEVIVLPQPEVDIKLINKKQFASTISSQEPVTYQWLKDGKPIEDGFESTYTPRETGEYSLIVLNQFGCSSISETIIFTADDVTGIEEPKELRSLVIFPNPNDGIFFIDFGAVLPNGEPNFSIIDALGRQINLKTERISSSRHRATTNNLAGGIYYIQIQTKDGVAFRKFILEE